MGTYDGLAVPLSGGYTSYKSNGTTSYLTVNADGTHDFSFADEGADNFISVTLTQSTEIASGYMQAFYTNLSCAGGSLSQINAFAADITLGGTVSGENSGVYIYFAETGTAVFGGTLNGFAAYFSAFASATPPATRAGLHVYSVEADANLADIEDGASVDAAVLADCSGATGTYGSILATRGVVQPEYLLTIGTTSDNDRLYSSDNIDSMTGVGSLKVFCDGIVYRIPLIADSCS